MFGIQMNLNPRSKEENEEEEKAPLPNIELEKGLVRVSNDRELYYMFDAKETFGRLELYLDHLDMDLLEYLSQAITTQMDAYAEMEVEQHGGSSQHPQKIDKGKENVSQNETKSVKARTITINKGKKKVSQDETEGVKARASTVDSDYDSEFDSEYDSDKSVDYLSTGEEELIELRNRMKANREAKAKAKGNSVSEINEPNDENSMSADNVRGETFEENDIYMNELLTRLKTINEDGKTQDPFNSVEKHVGEKYVTVEQFKECLTYYALANGFSLWYERSSGKKVVEKCGQRSPRFSVPEKGKQRKQNRLYDIADLVMKKYKCKVTPNWCTNAKKYALTEYEKIVGEHYAMLRSYGKEILDSNPGSTIKLGVTVNPDDKTYFDRFYVCFVRLTDRWKAGCRKVIALDGCFLKSPNQGEILTTIGRDGNNHIYPVAWAMGLIEAGKDVMPNAEHRQCARHIHENFRKQYF
ncbi:hypothetical protein Tco_1374736, partial [Tanacetum coccineum]